MVSENKDRDPRGLSIRMGERVRVRGFAGPPAGKNRARTKAIGYPRKTEGPTGTFSKLRIDHNVSRFYIIFHILDTLGPPVLYYIYDSS